jgi:hypothetical protein
MRNAVKAQVIVLLNSLLGLLVAFGVNLSDKQQLAVTVFVNAALGLWVLLTSKGSTPPSA